MPAIPRIFILTHCRDPFTLESGSLLTLRTLRTGFPNAEVTVVDNASLPMTVPAIAAAAREVGCAFHPITPAGSHHSFISKIIQEVPSGPVVLLDPDLVFWTSCEHWNFDRLLAGRMLPQFRDPYTQTITAPRLHTSFVWISDIAALRDRLLAIQSRQFDFDPIAPMMFHAAGEWYRFDTLAPLCNAIPEEIHAFTPTELSSYDHLFCGSHLSAVAPHLPEDFRNLVEQSHRLAPSLNPDLRGIWRDQERFFHESSCTSPLIPSIFGDLPTPNPLSP